MDKAEALFVYETAGRLLAAELTAFGSVHGRSPSIEVRQGMVLHATDTALALWRDVLGRINETSVPPRPAPSEPFMRG